MGNVLRHVKRGECCVKYVAAGLLIRDSSPVWKMVGAGRTDQPARRGCYTIFLDVSLWRVTSDKKAALPQGDSRPNIQAPSVQAPEKLQSPNIESANLATRMECARFTAALSLIDLPIIVI